MLNFFIGFAVGSIGALFFLCLLVGGNKDIEK